MKKTLLSILTVLTVGAFAQETNALNRGFENWTQKDYTYPDTLQSAVQDYVNRGLALDVSPVEKSTDAYEGANSLKLSSVETAGGDTINGYSILGDWGDNGPAGGFPYTFQADSFSFYYKCDLQPNDTAWVIFTLKKAGSSIGGGFYPIVGTKNTWTEYTAANSGFLLQPDTIFFAAIATNALDDESLSQPGSWVQLDRVGMKKANGDFKPMANGGFESWGDTSIHVIDDWYAYNYTKSTDAYEGTNAIELYVTERTDGDGDLDTASGFFSNSNIFENERDGIHYVLEPQALSVWVDYEPSGSDQANIWVNFYKSGSTVAGGSYAVTAATSGYTEVIIPTTFSMAPDSFTVTVFSGENPGSILRVDDMDLTDNPTSSTEVTTSKFRLYPNPASESITLSSKGSEFKVYDVLGSLIMSQSITSTKTQISLSEFQSGIYMVTVLDASNNVIGTKQMIVK